MSHFLKAVAVSATLLASTAPALSANTRIGYEDVGGVEIFCREAGEPSKPAIVLLHGFL